MASRTPKYNLHKPDKGETGWGEAVSSNFDLLEDVISGTLQGPEGPAGPVGSQGPQGPQGPEGPAAALSDVNATALSTTAKAGVGTEAARADHVHPTQGLLRTSLFTAKGAIPVAAGNNNLGQLVVGSDGQVLTAIASASQGVKWINPLLIDIETLGADPTGAADATAVIQARIDTEAARIASAADAKGGAVFVVPEGIFKFNVELKTGIRFVGRSINSSVCRPAVSGKAVFTTSQGNTHYAGVSNLYLYGDGYSSRITPYTISGQLGKTYRHLSTLATGLTAGSVYTSIDIGATTAAHTIPVNAVITLGEGGADVQIVRVTTATTLSTTVTVPVPVESFTASAAFAASSKVSITGGFNHGIYLPRGTGTLASSKTSGTWECVFKDLRIENFGNNGFHIEGGTIYQAQQFSEYRNIHIEYNHDHGIYMDGFVQNNEFRRINIRNNRSHNMVHQAWLANHITNHGWQTVNANSFTRCIFEVAGSYLDANGVLTAGTGTAHGVYSEGNENDYVSCYIENNGIQDTTTGNPSSGIYFNYVPSGNGNNRVEKCHFAGNWNDVYCYEGRRNHIDKNVLAWDGARPTTKFSFIRVHSDSASPVIGRNQPNTTTAPFIYNDDNTSPRTAFFMEAAAGAWTMGTPSTSAVTNAQLTIDRGHVAIGTDNVYDIGMAANRPRNVYAGTGLNVEGRSVTYAGVKPAGTTSDVRGSVVFNRIPEAGSPVGWVCVTAGDNASVAGTWEPFGQVGGNLSSTSSLAVTASPMSYTATSNGYLYIIDGTWNKVQVNAVTIATTNPAGATRVNKGDVVLFDYSGAPTAIKLQTIGNNGF